MTKKKKYELKEVKKIAKKDILIPDFIMRQLEDEKDSDIKGLSASISNGGMINEIDVRESKVKGKYDLIAGARRLVATKEDDILAKIFVNMSDMRGRLMCLNENYQRKDPESNATDAYIYETWKIGKQSGEFEYIQDLADEIGIDSILLGMIISAGKLKDDDPSPIIQFATTHDIDNTKDLSDHPELRKDLLKKKQEDKLTSEDMGKISEEIKSELDIGTEEVVVKKVLDIVDNTKKEKTAGIIGEKTIGIVLTGDVGGFVTNKESNKDPSKEPIKSEGDINKENISKPIVGMKIDYKTPKISDEKFTDTLNTYKVSPSDIKEKLEEGEINVSDARLLNQFDTPQRRDKVLNELKTAEEVHNWDNKRTIDTRLKQQEDLNNKGETDLKTRQDRVLEEELKKESRKNEIHDRRSLDRYQRMSSYILETVKDFHPRRLKTDDVRAKASKIFRGNYELFESILIELGNIKEVVYDDVQKEKRIGVNDVGINNAGNIDNIVDVVDTTFVETEEE
ncbi:MAG: ParB N-terminal domain-containing protein [Acidobacteriia bacterium]|nr:ParB N-terminal domain-containing protein [Terriglobia bacterium]